MNRLTINTGRRYRFSLVMCLFVASSVFAQAGAQADLQNSAIVNGGFRLQELLKERVSNLRAENDTLRESIEAMQQRLTESDDYAADLLAGIAQRDADIQALRNKASEHSSMFERLEISVEELPQLLDSLARTDERAGFLQRRLTAREAEIANLKQELLDARSSASALQQSDEKDSQQLLESKRTIDRLRESLRVAEAALAARTIESDRAASAELLEATEALASAEAELGNVRARQRTLDAEYAALEDRLNQVLASRANLQAQHSDQAVELERLRGSMQQQSQLVASSVALEQQNDSLRELVSQIRDTLGDFGLTVASLPDRLAAFDESERELSQLRSGNTELASSLERRSVRLREVTRQLSLANSELARLRSQAPLEPHDSDLSSTNQSTSQLVPGASIDLTPGWRVMFDSSGLRDLIVLSEARTIANTLPRASECDGIADALNSQRVPSARFTDGNDFLVAGFWVVKDNGRLAVCRLKWVDNQFRTTLSVASPSKTDPAIAAVRE